MKGKYEVNRYIGVVVDEDQSGQYIIKKDDKGEFKLHDWRTGKHTKGKFKGIGQLFLTENNMLVAVVDYEPVKFKDRHEFTPLQRFTSEVLNDEQLNEAKKRLD